MRKEFIPIGIAGAVLCADQAAKYAVKEKLMPGQKKPLAYVRHSRNYGAAMNFGQKHPGVVQAVSTGVTAAVGVAFALSLRDKRSSGMTRTGLGLLLAGGLSNTVDRYADGFVTDYLSFGPDQDEKGSIVYNIGDFAIAAGTALTMIGLEKEDNKKER